MASDSELLAAPSARCAADVALLDLSARQLGVPLHAVLLNLTTPSRPLERVPVCALASLAGVDRPGAPAAPAAPADLLQRVTDLVGEGYKVVKFKVGGSQEFSSELDQLMAVRAEFPYLKVRLDANGSWSSEEAHDLLGKLKIAIDPELVEQPVGPRELLTFGNSPVPLAADESLRLPDSVDAVTRPGACVAVVLKPMVLGGLRACLAAADTAHLNGARAIVSHSFGGPIAHAAACELALAVAAADPVGHPPAAGLAGHDELEQRAGPWLEPGTLEGHGVEAPW
ncbi:MAG: mandelate racemase/muconate lactonizing enzyme family protein [Gemmatimonadota bacterium]